MFNINKRPGVWEWCVCGSCCLLFIRHVEEKIRVLTWDSFVYRFMSFQQKGARMRITQHDRTYVTKNNTKIGLSSDNIKQHNVGKSRVQSGVLCDSFNTTPPTPLPLHAA